MIVLIVAVVAVDQEVIAAILTAQTVMVNNVDSTSSDGSNTDIINSYGRSPDNTTVRYSTLDSRYNRERDTPIALPPVPGNIALNVHR